MFMPTPVSTTRPISLLAGAMLMFVATTIDAQSTPRGEPASAAFVMTLGRDTVQVEAFTRSDTMVSGTVAWRSPSIRVLHWSGALDARGQLRRYRQLITDGNGRALASDAGSATMTSLGDTVIRETRQRDGTAVTHRIHAPRGAWPIGTIPIATSFALFELALAPLREMSDADSAFLYRLAATPVQTSVSRTPLLFTSPDSVHLDYFGQGRSRFVFDRDGRLQHADWRETTYDVRVNRVLALDVPAIAAEWTQRDRLGKTGGPLSPRDSLTERVGAVTIAINYSRPSRRGRRIWGVVVPWDTVWRLGADMATQLRLDAPLRFGEALVPAGEYTMWMRTSQSRPELVISSSVRVFGTQYDRRRDLVRVPMDRVALSEPIEQLRLTVTNEVFRVLWGDAEYRVPLRAP